MKNIFIRDGENHPHEIVITDGEGQIMVLPLTDNAMMDLHGNIAERQKSSWQRVKHSQKPQANFPKSIKE